MKTKMILAMLMIGSASVFAQNDFTINSQREVGHRILPKFSYELSGLTLTNTYKNPKFDEYKLIVSSSVSYEPSAVLTLGKTAQESIGCLNKLLSYQQGARSDCPIDGYSIAVSRSTVFYIRKIGELASSCGAYLFCTTDVKSAIRAIKMCCGIACPLCGEEVCEAWEARKHQQN
ncbi:MAG: hypothetical protein J6Y72_02415 [Bacteroidales bacterium]|nr:hypothetical protein [Bacteroidales bacterium]